MKEEYNRHYILKVLNEMLIGISDLKESQLRVPANKTICVRHCSICDTYGNQDLFLEWLNIIEIGSRIKVSDKEPYLDLKHILKDLRCLACSNGTMIQAVYEWVASDESES